MVHPTISDWNRFEEWVNGIQELSDLVNRTFKRYENEDFLFGSRLQHKTSTLGQRNLFKATSEIDADKDKAHSANALLAALLTQALEWREYVHL